MTKLKVVDLLTDIENNAKSFADIGINIPYKPIVIYHSGGTINDILSYDITDDEVLRVVHSFIPLPKHPEEHPCTSFVEYDAITRIAAILSYPS